MPSSNFPAARFSLVGGAAAASEQQAEVRRFDSRDLNPEHFTPLILSGGGYLARDYWVEAGVLHVLIGAGEHKMLPVSALDLEETVRLNQERNADFVLRTPDANLTPN